MDYSINHKGMEIAVKQKGAELFSVKCDNEEFMWNKKEVWAKSSPILFPFIGQVTDNKYIVDNKEYIIDTRHGFARDNDFELEEKSENKLVFSFKSNDETLKKYPYNFVFKLIYEILEKNVLKMTMFVENTNDKDMYFAVGAHPAFILDSDIEDFYILLGDKRIDLSDKIFENDALIYEGSEGEFSILKSKKTGRSIIVDHKGFPYIAYWRPLKSSFVCIEPWYGVNDTKEGNYNIENKKGIQKLKAREKFSESLVFTFNK